MFSRMLPSKNSLSRGTTEMNFGQLRIDIHDVDHLGQLNQFSDKKVRYGKGVPVSH
jgi:hypothetical protein